MLLLHYLSAEITSVPYHALATWRNLSKIEIETEVGNSNITYLFFKSGFIICFHQNKSLVDSKKYLWKIYGN